MPFPARSPVFWQMKSTWGDRLIGIQGARGCGKYLFEVGGRRKTFQQIKDIPDSFLAVDDLEISYGNRIPLWLFGLLY